MRPSMRCPKAANVLVVGATERQDATLALHHVLSIKHNKREQGGNERHNSHDAPEAFFMEHVFGVVRNPDRAIVNMVHPYSDI